MWNLISAIGETAGRLFLYLLAIAVFYPVLVIIAGTGWNINSWWWFFVHIGVGVVVTMIGILLVDFPVIATLTWVGAGFSFLSSFDILKPLGMGIGLIGAGAADIIIGLYAFGLVGAYGAVSAFAPGEEMTVQAAEGRARAALRGFVSVAAFQWAAGLFLFFAGREVSWHLGWILFFSLSILAHASIAWDTGGRWGRAVVIWGALAGLAVSAGMIIYRLGTAEKFWDELAWHVLGPFFWALVPFAIYIAPAPLRKRIFLRGVCALIGGLLLMRAVLLPTVPAATWRTLVGRDLTPYLELGAGAPPEANSVEELIRHREDLFLQSWLQGEIKKIEAASNWQQLDAASKEVKEGLRNFQGRRTGKDPVLQKAWASFSQAFEKASSRIR